SDPVDNGIVGKRVYELTNHLGNVMVTISDIKIGKSTPGGAEIAYYEADVVTAQDYYPGGMELPDRKYAATGLHRFGYQGSEKDIELNSNTYTTHFRELDTRIGRWWSIDPKINHSISSYVSMGNNPIWHSDVMGDTLDVNIDDKKSQEDVLSIVEKKNQKLIKFDNGRASLDFGKMSKSEITKALEADKGLNLDNDLINSNKKFLYEAVDYYLISSSDGTVPQQGYLATLTISKSKIINASNNGLDSQDALTYQPKKGYDGQVIIHPKASYEELDESGTTIIFKPRATMIFHELAESYERTHNGIQYQNSVSGTIIIKGAHELAKDRERKWKYSSNTPGEIASPMNLRSPSKKRKKQLDEIFSNYVSDFNK